MVYAWGLKNIDLSEISNILHDRGFAHYLHTEHSIAHLNKTIYISSFYLCCINVFSLFSLLF